MTDVAFEVAAAIKYTLDKANVKYDDTVPRLAAEVVRPLLDAMQKLTKELDEEVDTAWGAFENLAAATETAGLNKEVEEIVAKYRKDRDGEEADVSEEHGPGAAGDGDDEGSSPGTT